ncbi:MAG: hypothetical protein R3301_05895 [Saprospiraceae bacterium]|nr:hypothetical protein [Saprospiraceae bacterium]
MTAGAKHKQVMRGVCWVGGDSIATHNFRPLIENHVDWISQTPFGWQPHYDQPDIAYGSDRTLWGERDSGIRYTTALARQHGIKTILKPHIWLNRSAGKWRADIEMRSPAEWDAWFASYERFILHYALLAQECGIEVLCIGTELLIPSTRFPDRWRDLVGKIRSVYDGKLTYAANFHEEFEKISWWDALDYIGIQAYFPLGDHSAPTLRQLRTGWQPHLRKIETIYQRYQRPVLFTEIGYRNDALSAREPWLWPNQIDAEAVRPDDALQARCYRAFFETCWQQEWMAGVFFWKWFHSTWRFETREEHLAYRQHRIDSLVAAGHSRWARRARRQIWFSPQGREAERVMRSYFAAASRN